MSLVGKRAPFFTAPAVIEGNKIVKDFSLETYIDKQEVLLFFYPKDFTFVCPTEIISFQEYLDEFTCRGVAVVGCSTDTEESHYAWLNIPIENGGIKGVTYPLVADTTKTISSNYGVLGGSLEYSEEGLLEFTGLPISYRGTFLIDKTGVIRHQTVNDLSIGRNIEEFLRIIDMWHHVEAHGEVCPANWYKGKKSIKPTFQGISEYLKDYMNYNNSADIKEGCCEGNCGCSEGRGCNSMGCCTTTSNVKCSE